MKSIFVKLLVSILVILVCCIITIASVLFLQIYDYSVKETQKVLERDAEQIADNMVLYFEWPLTPPTIVYDIIKAVAKESDAEVLVVNNSCEILCKANENEFINIMDSYTYVEKETIDSSFIDALIENGIYTEMGTLNGYYKSPVYTVGVPVMSQDGTLYGTVLLSTGTDFLTNILGDMVQMVIVSLTVAFALAIGLAYILTRTIIKPLNQMNKAAVDFSRGKFDTRITVTGHDEIAGLAAAFNNMATGLEKIEKSRQDFVTNVTHEMKTPMTTIAGFVDGIVDGTIPEEKRNTYLKIISEEVRRLSRLVSQTLTASRLSSGEQAINPTQFDISELLCRVLVGFEQLVDEKKLKVNVDIPGNPIIVSADSDAMIQVIYNLVDNAIKYADIGGDVSIKLSTEGEKAKIEVYNTGRGIPQEEIPLVFDRFYKNDPSRGVDRESFGLGLYIVKAIINRHGEDIKVESSEGVFCRFTFTLPLA